MSGIQWFKSCSIFMDFEQLKSLENDNVLQTYGRFDLGLAKGKGAKVYDFDGNEYIDCTSGIGVNSLGHAHPVLSTALKDQIDTLSSVSNLYYSAPMIEAAAKLTEATGMAGVFFANSGAEANEGAIKLARKYSADKYGENRTKILTLKNSFHGRTIATLEATGQDKFHKNFYPFTGGFDYVEANNIDDLMAKADDSTAAIMMELIQGESGVRPLDPGFVKAAADLCNEKDILLIIDEVQTGVGRTGSLFCYEQYGLSPDIVTMAKGLGGGVPIGGFLTNEKTAHVLGKGDHGTTFGGNPLAGRAASTVMDIINTPEFLADVNEKSKLFFDLLSQIDSPDVKDLRGMGLMIGIEVPEEKIMDLIEACMAKGLLVLKAGSNTIRLLPPLVISEDEIRQAAAILKEVLENE